jgi:glyoxylase-like metal-dependent hydrolase (beta-lactamase superfamily II)
MPACEPLEDDFTWVLRKALKAAGLAPAQAAERAGVAPAAVATFSRGRFDAALAGMLAPALDLDPDAFAGLPEYRPMVTLPDGLQRLAFPFDGGTVNAWLVRAGHAAVLIDTGHDPAALRRSLDAAGLPVAQVWITHGHHDHAGGLAGLPDRPAPPVHAPAAAQLRGAMIVKPGVTAAAGPLTIRVLDLDGHWPGALGFHIDGLEVPVCAVGDAVFAGSVGGTPDPASHARALARIRAELLALPSATILLPGHGPPTSVGLERRHNPFLAGAQRGGSDPAPRAC